MVESSLIVVTAALLLLGVRRLLRRHGVRVDDRGILDPRLRRGWIRWDEIEGAYPLTAGGGQRVLLRLRPGGDEVPVDLSGSDVSSVELLLRIVAAGGRSRGAVEAPPAR